MAERTYRSFAKINLHLAVLGKRADGYHELRTIFQTVDLHDKLRVRVSEKPGIRLSVPRGGAPTDASNLAYRAAASILEGWAPGRGADIELTKRIPSGGGLGGGSSNAATVLLALDELLELDLGVETLSELAARLGADVPYFLTGGTALGTGRGDRIEPVAEMPEEAVWLVDPGVAVSTAEVFAAFVPPAAPRTARRVERLIAGEAASDIAALGGWNDLEPPVLERFPAVRSVYNALRRTGASCVRLSGSGGTVFACFASSGPGEGLTTALPNGALSMVSRTVSRRTLARSRIVEGEARSER